MINTLLSKIAGFFEREFLFASFLPGLLFATALGAAMLAVVGGESAWAGIASYDALQKGVFTFVGGLGVIVFSYVLHAMRSSFLDFWSGRVVWLRWGLVRVGEQRQRGRYHSLERSASRVPQRRKMLNAWMEKVQNVLDSTRAPLPREKQECLFDRISRLRPDRDDAEVAEILDKLLEAYRQHYGRELEDVYEPAKRRLERWAAEEEARIQGDSYCLDREFGTYESVRATRLGNVIESYQQYPTRRYRIEAEIFWPRLQKVISKEYMDLLQEPRILLDFSVTMTSLAVAYGVFTLMVGPWLWYRPQFWGMMAAASVAAAAFFYTLGVRAAMQLGEMIRSSFDLFRLDLLAALRLPEPATHAEEQAAWEQFSRLAVYGHGAAFNIQPKGG